jgi:hypothetical protein
MHSIEDVARETNNKICQLRTVRHLRLGGWGVKLDRAWLGHAQVLRWEELHGLWLGHMQVVSWEEPDGSWLGHMQVASWVERMDRPW